MKKFIITLLFPIALFSQERLTFSVYQDAKLFALGDDKGNDPLTINSVLRLEMQGKQEKRGYFVLSPEFEYADLSKFPYRRYAVNLGYTFNNIIKKTEQNINGSFGMINRYSRGFMGFGASAVFKYVLSKKINIGLLAQITDRKDLKWAYGSDYIRFSGFVGIEYKL